MPETMKEKLREQSIGDAKVLLATFSQSLKDLTADVHKVAGKLILIRSQARNLNGILEQLRENGDNA